MSDVLDLFDKVAAKAQGALADDPREQAIRDRNKVENGSDTLKLFGEVAANREIEARRKQREYAESNPDLAPAAEAMISNLGDRNRVLEVMRQMNPQQREEALYIAGGLAQKLGDDRGGILGRTMGAIQRGVSHGVSQPIQELLGIGGTPEEIEYIRKLDAAAAQEFNPSIPSDPMLERGALQATEMLPWMTTVVGGGGLGRTAATNVAGRVTSAAASGSKAAGVAAKAGQAIGNLPKTIGLPALTAGKAGELAGVTAASFPGQYAQEVDQLKQLGMKDGKALRMLAGGTAAITGLIEGIVPDPFGAKEVTLTKGAARAAREYLWEAAKKAPGEMTEEYLQGVTSGLGKVVAGYIDENAQDKTITDAFNNGWEQTKEAALPMAFLLGVPAMGGAGAAAARARRIQLEEIRSKGFVSAEDAKVAGIEGKNRKERAANVDAMIEQAKAEEAQASEAEAQGTAQEVMPAQPEQVDAEAADIYAARRAAQQGQQTPPPLPDQQQVPPPLPTPAPAGNAEVSDTAVPQPTEAVDPIGERTKIMDTPVVRAKSVTDEDNVRYELFEAEDGKSGVIRQMDMDSGKVVSATKYTSVEKARKEFGRYETPTDTASADPAASDRKPAPAPVVEKPVPTVPATKTMGRKDAPKAVDEAKPIEPSNNWKRDDRVFVSGHTKASGGKIPSSVGKVVKVNADNVVVQLDGETKYVAVPKDKLQLPDAKFTEGEKVGVPWSAEKTGTIKDVLPDGTYKVVVGGRQMSQTADRMVKLGSAEAKPVDTASVPAKSQDEQSNSIADKIVALATQDEGEGYFNIPGYPGNGNGFPAAMLGSDGKVVDVKVMGYDSNSDTFYGWEGKWPKGNGFHKLPRNELMDPVAKTDAPPVPVAKTPEEHASVPMFGVYETSIRGKKKFAVKEFENKGNGDSLFDSLGDANKEASRIKQRDADRKASQEKQKADEEAETKKQVEYEASFGGFLSDKPINKGRQLKVLGASRSYQGKVTTIKDIVEQKVAGGATVDEQGRLVSPDGAWLGSDKITKIGIDYAKHLIGTKSPDTVSGESQRDEEVKDAPKTKKGGDPNEVQANERQGQANANAETKAEAQGQVGDKGGQAAATPSPASSIRKAVIENGGYDKNSADDVEAIRRKLYDGEKTPSHSDIRAVMQEMKNEAGQKPVKDDSKPKPPKGYKPLKEFTPVVTQTLSPDLELQENRDGIKELGLKKGEVVGYRVYPKRGSSKGGYWKYGTVRYEPSGSHASIELEDGTVESVGGARLHRLEQDETTAPDSSSDYEWKKGSNGIEAKGLKGYIRLVPAKDQLSMDGPAQDAYWISAPSAKNAEPRPQTETQYGSLDEAKKQLIEANEKYGKSKGLAKPTVKDILSDEKKPMSKWEQGVTDLLSTVPAFKGASFELNQAKNTAKVVRPDGRNTTINFNADKVLDAFAKQKGTPRWNGAYIYKSGRKNDGHIYLRSVTDHRYVLNHEVVHWLEDEGIITPAEVDKYGGREGIAEAYGEWAAMKAKPANTLFEKIYDFFERIFDINAKFFKELNERVDATKTDTTSVQIGDIVERNGKVGVVTRVREDGVLSVDFEETTASGKKVSPRYAGFSLVKPGEYKKTGTTPFPATLERFYSQFGEVPKEQLVMQASDLWDSLGEDDKSRFAHRLRRFGIAGAKKNSKAETIAESIANVITQSKGVPGKLRQIYDIAMEYPKVNNIFEDPEQERLQREMMKRIDELGLSLPPMVRAAMVLPEMRRELLHDFAKQQFGQDIADAMFEDVPVVSEDVVADVESVPEGGMSIEDFANIFANPETAPEPSKKREPKEAKPKTKSIEFTEIKQNKTGVTRTVNAFNGNKRLVLELNRSQGSWSIREDGTSKDTVDGIIDLKKAKNVATRILEGTFDVEGDDKFVSKDSTNIGYSNAKLVDRVPVSTREAFASTLKATGVFSDGRVLIRVNDKDKDALLAKLPKPGGRVINVERLIEDGREVIRFKDNEFAAVGYRGGDVTDRTVFLRNGNGGFAIIDKAYHDTILQKHPTAKFFGSAERYRQISTPVAYSVDGEIVGLVMPIQVKRIDGRLKSMIDGTYVFSDQPEVVKPRSVRKDKNKGVEEGLKEASEGFDLIRKGLKDLGSTTFAGNPINADIARGLGMVANGLIKAGKYKFAEFLDEAVKAIGAPAVKYLAPYLEAGWNKKAETDSRLDKAGSVNDYLIKENENEGQIYPEGDGSDQAGVRGSVSNEGESGSATTSGSLEEAQSSDGETTAATADTGGLRGSDSGSVQQGSDAVDGNVEDGDVGGAATEPGTASVGSGDGEGFTRPGNGAGINLAPKSSRPNFHLTNPDVIVGRGLKDKFARNVMALELSQELEESGRPPTQEELETLASYIGWGAFGQELFQGNWNNTRVKKDWESENEWLREHLGEEEWRSAQESIPNAHYTDPEVVSGIWSMIERMGFKGGRFLEPSFGVGNFAALMPRDIMSATNFTAIELDKATARIAKILYPQINVQQKGYQDSRTPNDFYDVNATNVPFGNYKIVDRMYRMPYSIHNYFFRKGIDQTKPGGLMVFVTSNMTMDGKEEAKLLRKQLSDRGDLVAAFRFPTGAFERYAKTKVVADLIIIRKRKPGEDPSPLNKEWIDIVEVDTPSGVKVEVNEYWTKHPENILGTLNYGHGTTSGRPGMIVDKPANLQELWNKAIESVPQNILNTERTASEGKERANERKLRQNTVVHQNDELYIAKGEQLIPLKEYVKGWYRANSKPETIKKARDEIVALLKVRDILETVLEVQGKGEDASVQRKELNNAYDAFVGKYGPITTSNAIGHLKASGDAIANAVASLESRNANGEYEKRPVFTKTTVRQAPRIGEKLDPVDAFALARNNSVSIDWDDVASMAKMQRSEVLERLQKEGLIYKTGDDSYEAADVFLSGNMARKIRQLEAAKNEGAIGLDKAIDAAKAIMPSPLVYNQIQVSLGAPWVTAEDYSQFFADLLNEDVKNTKVLKAVKGWKVEFSTSANSSPAVVTHGHSGVAFSRMVAAAMNNGRVTIFYKDAEGNPHKDDQATLEANTKIDELKDKFKDWIWQSPDRIARLSQAYNEDHRSVAIPDWKNIKVPLLFEGLALQRGDDPFSLRKHQEAAVWRAIVSGKGLFAHEVGTGKTLTMASIAIESRRLRLANKPVLFAHNANSQAVYREAQEAYPGAKILYVNNLDPKNKGQAMASIATEDWDLIVIPHSLVENLKMRPETLERLLKDQMDQLEAAALEAFNEDDSPFKGKMPANLDEISKDELKKLKQRTAKELVKERLALRERIRDAQSDAANESTIFIEDMGIDMLLVDEAHIFKKIPLATRQQVKGLNKKASKPGNSLMLLSDYIRGTQNGRGIYLFTGTPITNTLNEIYNMQRFIMPDEMQAVGVKDWDGWFNTFATSETSDELSAGGTYEEFERLTSFVNMPELRASIGQYMDTVFASDMPEFIPRSTKEGRVEEGDPIIGRPYKEVHNETLQMMPIQKRLSENLKRRYRALRDATGRAKFEMMQMREYMPLVINGEGVKLALDPRLMDGVDASQIDPRDPRLKVNKMMLNAMEYYHSHPKATQMIFMELGHKDTADRVVGRDNDGKAITETVRVFNLAKEIKRRLMEEGVPESEIAIFSAMTKENRTEAARAMNRGEVRFAIGGTETLGTGINAQENLVAMHHMDAPWMPGALEQRNGRGLRQGNRWNTVHEHRYLTEGPQDGRRWQVLLTKDRFIYRFMHHKGDERMIDMSDVDLDEEGQGDFESTFSAAVGDPRIQQRFKLEREVEKLKQAKDRHHKTIQDSLWEASSQERNDIPRLRDRKESYLGIQKKYHESRPEKTEANPNPEPRLVLSDNLNFSEKDISGSEAISDVLEQVMEKYGASVRKSTRKIAEYRGVDIFLQTSPGGLTATLYVGDVNLEIKPSFASLDGMLRNLGKRITALETELGKKESFVKSANESAKLPFARQQQLYAKEKKLAALIAEIEANPEGSPFWFRNMAPIGTSIYIRKRKRSGGAQAFTDMASEMQRERLTGEEVSQNVNYEFEEHAVSGYRSDTHVLYEDGTNTVIVPASKVFNEQGEQVFADIEELRQLNDTSVDLTQAITNLPTTLYQTSPNDINKNLLAEAVDLAIAAEDAGIRTYDQLVAFSVKTIGEDRTRTIGVFLYSAGKAAGMKGVRPTKDVLGFKGMTRDQAVTFAKVAFPMLTDEQIEAGIQLQDITAFGRDEIGYAPFGSPVPGQGLYQASGPDRLSMNFKDVTKRIPELQEAAKKLKAGDLSREEYAEIVDKYKPVLPYEKPPVPATPEQAKKALGAKSYKYGVPSQTLVDGDQTQLRLDIPAYTNHGTWVVSVHKPTSATAFDAGKVVGYESAARLTDVKFGMKQNKTLEIAAGGPKGTFATINGKWAESTPEEISQLADEAMNDPSWVQVGMDPERHGYFYNRATMQPIVSADDLLQVGPLGLAKNPVYGDPSDFMYQGQEDAGNVKGWTSFISATRAIIGATDKADVSTFIHEFFHPMRRFLLDRSVPESKRFGITDNEIKVLEDYSGVKDGEWTVEAEEKAAKAWEQYWLEGKSPTTKLDTLFEKISKWMQEVYKGIKQITGGSLPVEVSNLFDKLVQRGLPADERATDTTSGDEGPLTSIKNAIMNELREMRGMPQLADAAVQTQQEWLDEAEVQLRQDPLLGSRLVQELNDNARNLSNIEVAVLQLYYRQMNNQLEEASEKWFTAKDDGDAVQSARMKTDVDLIMKNLATLEEASKKAGREWGRAGVARQIALAKDFSLASILRKARIANAGNELNEEQLLEMQELAERVGKLEGALAEATQKIMDLERQQNTDKGIEEEKNRVGIPAPKSKSRQNAASKVLDFAKKFAGIFSVKQTGTDTLQQTEEERMVDEAETVVQAYVEAGVHSFGEFIAQVKKDLGGELPMQAQIAFAAAWQNIKAQGDIPSPTVDRTNASAMTRFARKIQRALVESGITERDEVVEAVRESLAEMDIELSKREVMDALSGYGQFSQLSKDEIDIIIRDINGQLQQQAKIEDMEAGIAPSKTGSERRTPTQAERDLIRKVNELKRTSKYFITDPDAQLKTMIGAAMTAASNRIVDLKAAMAKREAIVKTSVDLNGKDPELDRLRKELAEVTADYKKMFPKPGVTDAQRLAAAVRAVDREIAKIEEQLSSGNVMPKGRKDAVVSEELTIKQARLDSLREMREAARLKQDDKYKDKIAEKLYKANLMARIADYQDRANRGYFDPKPKKDPRKLSDEELRLKKELQDAKDEFFRRAGLYRLEHMSPRERAWDWVKETTHLSRAFMTSIDLSAVFRQGGIASFSHPKLASEAAKEMYNAMKSEQAEFKTAEEIRQDKLYDFAIQAGLEITTDSEKITKQEEAYMGRWAKHGFGKSGGTVNKASQFMLTPISASARAYTTFLNSMRFKLFKQFVSTLGADGQLTLDEAKVLASFINVSTGRGDLGKWNQTIANASLLFFAPRYVISRVQYFAMPFYVLPSSKVSGRVKKLIAQEYARYGLGLSLFMGAVAILGRYLTDDEDEWPTIELDPRSSDFMKIKIGETRIDTTSGLSQIVTFATQVGIGQKKRPDGEIRDMRGEKHKWGDDNTWDVMADFVRKKFAPVPGAATNVIVRENVVGDEVTPLTAVRDLFVPLSFREIANTMESRDVPSGLVVSALALLGMGGGTYGPKTKYMNAKTWMIFADETKRKELFDKDLDKMEWNSPNPAYEDFLTAGQLEQVNQRREERKQELVVEALGNPQRDSFLSEENFTKAVARRDEALKAAKDAGMTYAEVKQLTLDYWKRVHKSPFELKGGRFVMRDAVVARLREARKVFDEN